MPEEATKKRGLTIEDKELKKRCYDMFMLDFTLSEITKIENVGYMRLAQWSCRENWNERKTKVMGMRDALHPPVSVSPMIKALAPEGKEAIIERISKRKERIADKVSKHIDEDLDARDIVHRAEKVSTAMQLVDRSLGIDKEEGGSRSLISLTFLNANPAETVKIIEVNRPQLEDE